MKYSAIIVCLIMVLAINAFAEQATSQPSTQPESAAPANATYSPTKTAVDVNYIIQPEDILQLDVWGEPDMSRQNMHVTPEGNVNVPFIGTMKAAGLTLTQLADAIAQAYIDAQILKTPRVVVSILALHKRTVRVLGQVNRPGEYEFREGDTVMEAIANAASFNENAYLQGATLTRRNGTVIHLDLHKLFYKGDMTQNLKLEKGDTINIPEDLTNQYYVLGEIMRPGLYKLKEGMTALGAISLAGGPTPRGTMSSVAIIRNNGQTSQRIKLNMTKLINQGDTKQDLTLQPGDVVYVAETSTPDWAKISQILNTILSATYITRRY